MEVIATGERAVQATAWMGDGAVLGSFETTTRILHPWLEESRPGRRTALTWRERCRQAGVTYGPGLWHLDFSHARRKGRIPHDVWCWEGQLDNRSQAELIGVLADLMTDGPVNWFYGVSAIVTGGEPTVLRSPLAKLDDVRAGFQTTPASPEPLIGPEYWWPDDRSWFVHTDYDATSTDVHGPAVLGRAQRSLPQFETFALESGA